MQMNRPCVTTIYGVRGFSDYFEDDCEILIAQDDATYAEKVIKLLQDQKLNHTIATKAYSSLKAHFSRDAFNRIVEQNLTK